MVLYSKFTYGSQFSEEKSGLEIRFLVPEILRHHEQSGTLYSMTLQSGIIHSGTLQSGMLQGHHNLQSGTLHSVTLHLGIVHSGTLHSGILQGVPQNSLHFLLEIVQNFKE